MWFATRIPMDREVIPLAKREVSMVLRRRPAEAGVGTELLLGLLAPLPMLVPFPAYLAALLASKELAALLPFAGKSWLTSCRPDDGVLAFRRLVALRWLDIECDASPPRRFDEDAISKNSRVDNYV